MTTARLHPACTYFQEIQLLLNFLVESPPLQDSPPLQFHNVIPRLARIRLNVSGKDCCGFTATTTTEIIIHRCMSFFKPFTQFRCVLLSHHCNVFCINVHRFYVLFHKKFHQNTSLPPTSHTVVCRLSVKLVEKPVPLACGMHWDLAQFASASIVS